MFINGNIYFFFNRIPKLSPMDEPAVIEIANKHNKLPAQVLLRHIIQRGIAVIPKSSNPDRIRQNIDVSILYSLSSTSKILFASYVLFLQQIFLYYTNNVT